MRRCLTVAILIALATSALSGVAAADHLMIEVSGPEEVIVGEDLEISAVVRGEADGLPIEGATAVFIGDSFFAGVAGEIELGSVQTNNIGVATFAMSFSVRGVHRVRVEVHDGGETQEADLTIGVDHGPQIVAAEAGVEIPGLGSWLVTFIIACVWAVMIVAAVWMARVSRSGKDREDELTGLLGEEEPPATGRRRRRFNLATTATGAIVLLSLGLVTLLIRSPETHHNFDPEGYNRSPVAYLDAAYVYPGPGLIDGDSRTGDAVDDGRALFLKLGCAGCHGLDGQGASSARSPAFSTRQWLETVVRTGLPGGMPAYAESDVNDADLDSIHAFLLEARDALADETPAPAAGSVPATTTTTVGGNGAPAVPSFADVRQVLQPNCSACHGAAGGWSAADRDSVINSGDNGPAVIPGDAEGSVLAQKLRGTQTFGTIMPPGGSLSEPDIQLIIDWIAGGASP
jgi:mono/diheme cytochrome c family protein